MAWGAWVSQQRSGNLLTLLRSTGERRPRYEPIMTGLPNDTDQAFGLGRGESNEQFGGTIT